MVSNQQKTNNRTRTIEATNHTMSQAPPNPGLDRQVAAATTSFSSADITFNHYEGDYTSRNSTDDSINITRIITTSQWAGVGNRGADCAFSG
ncbi:hypothetical protein VKT23_000261 [Stygiomarasmius scandens]|uniref:Uncharacterized protein n=1 Tax=Marasmiellus scandens TaxID=2682957 RepID=A0ABR1K3Z3_9AGAR